MTRHAEYALARPCISEIINLTLAVAAFETIRTKRLVAREDSEVFNLVAAGRAAVGAVVAYEGTIAEQEEVGIRIEQGATSVTAEAVNMPSIASWRRED